MSNISRLTFLSRPTAFSRHTSTVTCSRDIHGSRAVPPDDMLASFATAQLPGPSPGQVMVCGDMNMNSLAREHALDRAAQAEHAAGQRAAAQQYKASFDAKNELALATLTASKVTGQLLLDCLAHAASERMHVLDTGTADPSPAAQQQSIAYMGIWASAAAAVRVIY